MEMFASQLNGTLKVCFTDHKNVKTRKEKMWEAYFTLRSTDEFSSNWASFLKQSGAEVSQTLYQHVTDIVFNHLLKEHFTPPSQPKQDTCTSTIDYNEKNALRYVSGYITRTLYGRLKNSKHQFKDELCLCIAELNDVDPDELEDESSEWICAIDRGGLKHISNMTYAMFASAEMELRKHLTPHQVTDFSQMREKIINDDDVQFYWSMVASNWEDEVADVLLEMIIDEYVKIRGHSTASAWLEQYKRDSKKQVQKSKGVRKQLISKPTSTSTSKTAPSGVSEDPDQV